MGVKAGPTYRVESTWGNQRVRLRALPEGLRRER